MVTELNFPLNGTMTAARAIHNPITNHGTHRPGGVSFVDATLTFIDPPEQASHRLSEAEFVPSESETIINLSGAPRLRAAGVRAHPGIDVRGRDSRSALRWRQPGEAVPSQHLVPTTGLSTALTIVSDSPGTKSASDN
ncbi:hypothetical protein [Actinoplanes sp. URMC 104]|uniref:hypothetical protein n=1 Tax=Actinoplanes sp. URMC 104 TaxID=3423409 RepID=UPI003F1AB8E9